MVVEHAHGLRQRRGPNAKSSLHKAHLAPDAGLQAPGASLSFAQGSHDFEGTVAKLAMRQPFVLFKGLTFQKLCLPGAFRPGDHHNKMLRPGLCVVHASPQYL